MNKEEKFIKELFEKTEKNKPVTTEIVNMPAGKIVPNFKNPYKCREEDMKPLEDSIRENGIIQPIMVRKDDKADVYEIISGHRRFLAASRLEITETEELYIVPDEIKVSEQIHGIVYDVTGVFDGKLNKSLLQQFKEIILSEQFS